MSSSDEPGYRTRTKHIMNAESHEHVPDTDCDDEPPGTRFAPLTRNERHRPGRMHETGFGR